MLYISKKKEKNLKVQYLTDNLANFTTPKIRRNIYVEWQLFDITGGFRVWYQNCRLNVKYHSEFS